MEIVDQDDEEVLIDYFLCTLFISSILSIIVLIPKIESVSALYMLSALVQSAAAIFAIVFSLSLIAIQLAAPYSFKILTIFLGNVQFRMLFLVLAIIIIVGLNGLLAINGTNISIYIKFILYILIFLTVFMFFILMSYFRSILRTLNPIRLIDQIIEKTNVINILETDSPGNERDPVQPVTDILLESLRKNDENAVLYGLDSLTSKIESIMDDSLSEQQQWQIANEFNYHLFVIGRRVFNRDFYINISVNIIDCLNRIGLKSIQTDKTKMTHEILLQLKSAGSVSIENRNEVIIIKISKSLGDSEIGIGVNAYAKRYYDLVQNSIFALRDIGKAAINNRLVVSSSTIIESLNRISGNIFYNYKKNIDSREKDDITSRIVVESLAAIAKEANSQDLIEILRKLIFDIRHIGQLSAREKFPNTASYTAESFAWLSKEIGERGNYKIIPILISALSDIGPKFADADLNGAARSAVNALLTIIKITNDGMDPYERSKIRIEIAKCLKNIGIKSARKNQKEVSSLAALAFGYFSEPSKDLSNLIKNSLEEFLDSSDDPNTCVQIAQSLNAFDFSIEGKKAAEKAAKKAISKDSNYTMAYLQLHNALRSQEILLKNKNDNENADEKKKEADKAIAEYNRLMKLEK